MVCSTISQDMANQNYEIWRNKLQLANVSCRNRNLKNRNSSGDQGHWIFRAYSPGLYECVWFHALMKYWIMHFIIIIMLKCCCEVSFKWNKSLNIKLKRSQEPIEVSYLTLGLHYMYCTLKCGFSSMVRSTLAIGVGKCCLQVSRLLLILALLI